MCAKKFNKKIMFIVLLSTIMLMSCNKQVEKKSNIEESTSVSTTETTVHKTDEEKKLVKRATSSSPNKNPNLDKVKITGALTGDIKKDIKTNGEVSKDKQTVSFYVDPVQVTGLKLGDTTKVDIGNGLTYEAKINQIPTQAVNGKYKIDARFVGSSPTIIPTSPTVSYTYKKSRVKYIPRSIVYYEDTRPYVYIVDYDDIVRKRYITIGEETKDYIELLENLVDNTFFITDWTEEITDGEEVNYILDTYDYIDDDLITIKDSDSLTINDGDGEITFYSDGSFGGSGNFNLDDNEKNYNDMTDQYTYQETEDSTELTYNYETEQYTEIEHTTEYHEPYDATNYYESNKEDEYNEEYTYEEEEHTVHAEENTVYEEEHTAYEGTTEEVDNYDYTKEEEYNNYQDEADDNYNEPEEEMTTTEEYYEDNAGYDSDDSGE